MKGGKSIMKKKLYRSEKDYKIAGVCGGIAEYFDVDSTLIRLLTVIFVLLGGAGVVAYIIAWIIVPKNPGQVSDDKLDKREESKEKIKKEAEEVKEWKEFLRMIGYKRWRYHKAYDVQRLLQKAVICLAVCSLVKWICELKKYY